MNDHTVHLSVYKHTSNGYFFSRLLYRMILEAGKVRPLVLRTLARSNSFQAAFYRIRYSRCTESYLDATVNRKNNKFIYGARQSDAVILRFLDRWIIKFLIRLPVIHEHKLKHSVDFIYRAS